MSLHFCDSIHSTGSEFGVKRKYASTLPFINGLGCCWWCDGVSNVFLAHFGPLVPPVQHLNTTAYLSIVDSNFNRFDFLWPVFWWLLPAGYTLCPKVISNWFLKQENQFSVLKWPPVTRCQSKRAHLGCDGMKSSHHGCADNKSAASMLSCQYAPQLGGIFPAPC